MPPVQDRLERIAAAAGKRVASQEARKQQAKVAKAFRENKPANAEPDLTRRLVRVQAVAACDAGKARKLLGGEAPENVLTGDKLFGAERLLGETVDFLPVSFLVIGQSAASPVARVIQRRGNAVGSGFLISKSLFLTNNHVIASSEEAGQMLLEFDYETDLQGKPRATTRFALDPKRFFHTNGEDDFDFTVVAVGERVSGERALADFGCCPLSDRGDKHMLGEFVNLIQHPEGDYKQLVLRENKLVSRLDTVLHYAADTQPGSSGSPVFNDEWDAIALHHWGGPHREQPRADKQNQPAMINEGIRVSAIVSELKKKRPGLTPAQRTLLDEALNAAPRNLPTRVHEGTHRPPTQDGASVQVPAVRVNSDGSVTLTLDLSVRLAAGPDDRPPRRGIPTTPGAEKLPPDPDYSSREGYGPDFLPGFPVSMPKVTPQAPGTGARLLHPAPGSDPHELKYEHFSIVVNKTRKLPFVTAANIDGKRLVKVSRKTGRAVSDDDDGDEGAEASETWYVDPRIADEDQTDQPLYDHQSPRVFDRGHQVRREDPNWGTAAAAERANADTFHFTNCCPQEFRFNQRPKFWAGIENFVLDNARVEKARVSVFTGPVFASTDPTYRDVRVPLQFYKVIARVEGGHLKATAFLASQAELLSTLPERLSGAEGFADIGQVRQYLTTVAEVEEITGLDFGSLRDHDTFTPEARGARRPILAESDLRAALGVGPAPAPRARGAGARLAEELEAFSAASLSATAFDWRTVLSAALASQLAYSDGAAVEATAVGDWGLETCEFVSEGATQCFVASSRDAALVAFRGTESVRDWLANLDTLYLTRPYGKVHRGFYYALLDVYDQVRDILARLAKAKVLLTGHSLGGALATLFAAEAPSDLPISWIHTFGQPRVGIGGNYGSALDERYGTRFVRVVNDDDIVPRVPPWPFRHVGRLVHFDAAGNVSGDPERLAIAARDADSPPALSEDEFRRIQQQLRTTGTIASERAAEGIFPSIADHAIAKYVAKIAAQVS